MKVESNNTKQARELAVDIPATTLKKIKKAAIGYGNREKLANASGVSAGYISHIIGKGRATQTNIEKLLAGIELMKTENTAA